MSLWPSLKTLEPHWLRALIEEDLWAHPNSLLSEIHRCQHELEEKDIRRLVYAMVDDGAIIPSAGGTKNRRYSLL